MNCYGWFLLNEGHLVLFHADLPSYGGMISKYTIKVTVSIINMTIHRIHLIFWILLFSAFIQGSNDVRYLVDTIPVSMHKVCPGGNWG